LFWLYLGVNPIPEKRSLLDNPNSNRPSQSSRQRVSYQFCFKSLTLYSVAMIPRLYLPDCANIQAPDGPTATVRLSREQDHYLMRVLRLSAGDRLTVFDGQGREAPARVASTSPAGTELHLGHFQATSRESPLSIVVLQALCTGDKMDWVVEKATELGAAEIWPVQTQRSLVRLDASRALKRQDHWQRIAEAAAAQSGRNQVPLVAPVRSWEQALVKQKEAWQGSLQPSEPQAKAQSAHPDTTPLRGSRIDAAWLLDPGAATSVSSASLPTDGQLAIAIGPEAGFTENEIALAVQTGFTGVRCGPRVLRTETAAAAVLAAVATRLGEF
jgi:16S rRNA (uracil1498-N3)-methyltransferase